MARLSADSRNGPKPQLAETPSKTQSSPIGNRPLIRALKGILLRPDGSVALSGLFPTYAYRFQLCGSPRVAAAGPAGSGEIQRPWPGCSSRLGVWYSPETESCVSPVKFGLAAPPVTVSYTSPKGAKARSKVIVLWLADDASRIEPSQSRCQKVSGLGE